MGSLVAALAAEAPAVGEPLAAAASFNIAQGLPAAIADRRMVEFVLRELLANARKFHAGNDRLELDIGSEQHGDEAEYWVRDNGPGYPASDAARLFEPMQRLHGGDYPGAGLGLFVARQLVVRNGGRMWAEASGETDSTGSSRGMCVRFVLPVPSHIH